MGDLIKTYFYLVLSYVLTQYADFILKQSYLIMDYFHDRTWHTFEGRITN